MQELHLEFPATGRGSEQYHALVQSVSTNQLYKNWAGNNSILLAVICFFSINSKFHNILKYQNCKKYHFTPHTMWDVCMRLDKSHTTVQTVYKK